MGSTLSNLLYHIIFSTKNREHLLTSELNDELYRYMGGIIKGEGGIPIAIGGMADHIHMIIKLRPAHSLADIMRDVKSSSSKWINQQNRITGRFTWQDGYGAFTISESKVSQVIHYIQNQKEHHQQLSFKDELILFLQRHGVEYDERYLWT